MQALASHAGFAGTKASEIERVKDKVDKLAERHEEFLDALGEVQIRAETVVQLTAWQEVLTAVKAVHESFHADAADDHWCAFILDSRVQKLSSTYVPSSKDLFGETFELLCVVVERDAMRLATSSRRSGDYADLVKFMGKDECVGGTWTRGCWSVLDRAGASERHGITFQTDLVLRIVDHFMEVPEEEGKRKEFSIQHLDHKQCVDFMMTLHHWSDVSPMTWAEDSDTKHAVEDLCIIFNAVAARVVVDRLAAATTRFGKSLVAKHFFNSPRVRYVYQQACLTVASQRQHGQFDSMMDSLKVSCDNMCKDDRAWDEHTLAGFRTLRTEFNTLLKTSTALWKADRDAPIQLVANRFQAIVMATELKHADFLLDAHLDFCKKLHDVYADHQRADHLCDGDLESKAHDSLEVLKGVIAQVKLMAPFGLLPEHEDAALKDTYDSKEQFYVIFEHWRQTLTYRSKPARGAKTVLNLKYTQPFNNSGAVSIIAQVEQAQDEENFRQSLYQALGVDSTDNDQCKKASELVKYVHSYLWYATKALAMGVSIELTKMYDAWQRPYTIVENKVTNGHDIESALDPANSNASDTKFLLSFCGDVAAWHEDMKRIISWAKKLPTDVENDIKLPKKLTLDKMYAYPALFGIIRACLLLAHELRVQQPFTAAYLASRLPPLLKDLDAWCTISQTELAEDVSLSCEFRGLIHVAADKGLEKRSEFEVKAKYGIIQEGARLCTGWEKATAVGISNRIEEHLGAKTAWKDAAADVVPYLSSHEVGASLGAVKEFDEWAAKVKLISSAFEDSEPWTVPIPSIDAAREAMGVCLLAQQLFQTPGPNATRCSMVSSALKMVQDANGNHPGVPELLLNIAKGVCGKGPKV